MKKSCLILILMSCLKGFSQEIDSLSIVYSIGHDCSYTIDAKTLRGGCQKKETISYSKRNNHYKISSFKSKEIFREWKEGFRENLIEDSILTIKSIGKRKLEADQLDHFLKAIYSIKSKTIFPYALEDVPLSFFENDPEKKRTTTKVQTDSILKRSFFQVTSSSVVRIFSIDFHYQGKKYSLKKSENVYWTLYFQDEKGEDRRLEFIYFDLEEFLVKNLPKKFSGTRILKGKQY